MAQDYLVIACTPLSEECEQVGTQSYNRDKAILECRVFRAQLERVFGEPPEGARFKIVGQAHDFGTYHEVYIYFEDSNKSAIDYALNVEYNIPETWDEIAHQELGTFVA